jgi:hypothetical protein
MTDQPLPSAQPYATEETADAIRERKDARASAMWKIVAAIVIALFILVLLVVGSRLVWLGSG